MANDCFPQFSALPTELRLMIWQHAYEGLVVAGFSCTMSGAPPGEQFLSSDYFPIARSCKEAWRAFKSFHDCCVFDIKTEPVSGVIAWLDLSNIVFYLGRGQQTLDVLPILLYGPLVDCIYKIAFGWLSFRDLRETCKRLVGFSALETVFILDHQILGQSPQRRSVTSALDLNEMSLQIRGKSRSFETSRDATQLLKQRAKQFLAKAFKNIDRESPRIEIVASNFK